MELKKAKEVLQLLGPVNYSKFVGGSTGKGIRIEVHNGSQVRLTGTFSPDQLEALTLLMRNPEGVVNS